MSDEIQPISGAKMREMRERGVVTLFPSGNYYRVRVVGAAPLLRRGSLPNVLLAFVIDAVYNGVTNDKMDAFIALQEREEKALEFLESLRIVCEETLLEPRIVANPQADDEMSIADLPVVDQGWAFRLAFAPAEALSPFRPQSQADVASVPVTEDVPQASE